MALALNLYDIFRRKQMTGQTGAVDLTSLTVKCLIVTNSYTPDQNAHEHEDDITNEVTGSNYTAGGNTLANPVVSLTAGGQAEIDFDDPATWSQHASGFSDGRRYIFYIDRGGASSANELIGYSDAAAGDFGNNVTDHTLQLHADGLFISTR